MAKKLTNIQEIVQGIISQLDDIRYDGDLADIGNEIGIAIGKYIKKRKAGYTLRDFNAGLGHGISIANGTH